MQHRLGLPGVKAHLSRLLEHVERGKENVSARAGRAVACPVPYHQRPPRTPGGWERRLRITEDFDELPEEMAAAFRGERL